MSASLSTPAAAPRAYEIDGEGVAALQFIRAACEPQRSVVVEACAGSGKTWLLVARMLRLLLAGAEPSELLAITFTRKAAQEMRERLLQLLQELAVLPEPEVMELLVERGLPEPEAARLLPAARALYGRVLASPQALSIDTFHSWFARLLKIAPLASGVPHGYSLTESTAELRKDAWSRLMTGVNDEPEVKTALVKLYEQLGITQAQRLLDAFVEKRAEWWALHESGSAIAVLRELCQPEGGTDARLALWEDAALKDRLLKLSSILGKGSKTNQARATEIEKAVTEGPGFEHFGGLCQQLFDDKGEPRRNGATKALLEALAQDEDFRGIEVFNDEFNLVAAQLLALQRKSFEPKVLEMNEALFSVGQSYLDHYQALKGEQRVFDFADLEWQAWRLLNDEAQAAYLHSRLDARYKHILLDEFQDTNPLQWSIVRAWLDAYGGDAAQPTVFIVGDPKQSIYRFRRAEPRVFGAAAAMLKERGAAILRTNQTRRNAPAIVDALNRGMLGNALYSPQTTLSKAAGTVWRLPLVRAAEKPADEDQGFRLRDPLTEPREEEDDARRQDEGHAVARAILRARQAIADAGAPQPAWSDVMLLVKKRSHLAAYESALRAAGIPFASDRRGGLLESLEVADLVALLSFLITPGDNRALAHVLKSPVFGASDDDLIALARQPGALWWDRLRAAPSSAALQRAVLLLGQWHEAALQLPVHDLLDRIFHQGKLVARYAQSAAPLVRGQVTGNLEAFIELALNLDAGRYPSLPKFIDALNVLRNGAQNEAPDEANIDAALDAVRILTIHSAKGLEARIVVLLDTNNSEAMREDLGILCDWPQDSDVPLHFSAFGKRAERGVMRDSLFAEEERLKAQEDWNLLYVAATRAKELLVISGVAAVRGADEHGIVPANWYARLLEVPLLEESAVALPPPAAAPAEFELSFFDPEALPAAPLQTAPVVSSPAIDEGIALHGLLERLTGQERWPVALPDEAAITRWLGCDPALAAIVRGQANTILSMPALRRFFNPALYVAAYNELDVMTDSGLARFDRLVVFEDEVWVLDYKRNLLENEREDYHAQLAGYVDAARMVYPDKAVRAALVLVDGRFVEMEALR